MFQSPHAMAATPIPSVDSAHEITAVEALSDAVQAVAVLVPEGADVPDVVGLGRDALVAAGWEPKPGSTTVVPREGAPVVVVATGPAAELDATRLRDAAAAAARATARLASRLGVVVPSAGALDARRAGAALAEGLVLGRYRYTAFTSEPKDRPLEAAELLVAGAATADLAAGIADGLVAARAASVARDLANTPPAYLTAARLADVAADLGSRFGFEVESFDREQLVELRCGGILGVNAGSAEEPRMIKLRYAPPGAREHLGMVGKGIMYDSGGISIKPSDPMHLLMKMDMGGAAAILGAFTALRDAGVTTAATAWLMCTDNMPSGSAYKLGDVLTARNGTTVEVKNTDAEGRLAMMDALVLAVEEGVDAVVDVATLTGAALMALGTSTAALFGNDPDLLGRVKAAAATVDEPVWELPLERKYRKQLDSEIADISNLGGPHAGATTAALFLAEFVGETPWAHPDIAGTMQTPTDDSWRSAGATGFGARLLVELAAERT